MNMHSLLRKASGLWRHLSLYLTQKEKVTAVMNVQKAKGELLLPCWNQFTTHQFQLQPFITVMEIQEI